MINSSFFGTQETFEETFYYVQNPWTWTSRKFVWVRGRIPCHSIWI